jgi:hypothetical protein
MDNLRAQAERFGAELSYPFAASRSRSPPSH